MSEVESQKKCSQQREKQEEYTPQLVWYQRDAAASDVLESFWSPRKTSNSSVFSAEGWRKHHKDFDIFYVLMNKTDITAEERENVHFLQHDDTEADFFQRCVLQNGLKCKAFKCKSMAFVFTWSTHILYNSTTMFRRTETTSSTIFDTQF